MKFTSKQAEVIEIAKKNGVISLETLMGVYSSPIARKANLQRFITLGIFTAIEGEKFRLNREKLEEIENGN